ncbi:MAG TPA: hypothetical protein VG845_02525 [Dehalococcoidia bacterium]|nr:hypothetical protein [Dehalococcoidia bacterium]
MVKEYVDEREMSGAMFKPGSKSHREAHLQAVQNIAEQLFPFPTPEYPHFRTFVNEPEAEQKIFTNYGNELEPDIVVLQWPEKLPVMVAEVVTPDMLRDDLAENVWSVEARLNGVKFFLYVPAGSANHAKALLKKHKIKDVSLRTWRNITGLKTIDVAALR